MKVIYDLVKTPDRQKIFQSLSLFENTFTSKDVQIHLQEQGTNIKIITVQNLLRALCYRGYLERFPIKSNTTRGRSTLHFKRIQL